MEMPGNREREVREISRVQMVEVLANNGWGGSAKSTSHFQVNGS